MGCAQGTCKPYFGITGAMIVYAHIFPAVHSHVSSFRKHRQIQQCELGPIWTGSPRELRLRGLLSKVRFGLAPALVSKERRAAAVPHNRSRGGMMDHVALVGERQFQVHRPDITPQTHQHREQILLHARATRHRSSSRATHSIPFVKLGRQWYCADFEETNPISPMKAIFICEAYSPHAQWFP